MKDAWINALEIKGLKSFYKWEVFTTERSYRFSAFWLKSSVQLKEVFQFFSGYNQKWFWKRVTLNVMIWLISSSEIMKLL